MHTHRTMADAPILHVDARRVLDVVGGDLLVADGREMGRVARVVAADHDHQIERLGDQLEHGILPFLRRRTDRVESTEMLAEGFGAPAPRHALSHLTGDGERFSREHRGLIGHTYTPQVVVRIEPRRHLACELLEKTLPRSPSFDVFADDPRFIHVADDEVFAPGIFIHLTRRGLRLFVVVLTVDQRGEAISRVHLDALPDVQYRSARRVDEHAANGAQPLEVSYGHAECGQDADVAGGHGAEVELTVPPFGPVQKVDAHGGKLLIDVWVVDDLADQKRPLVGKLRARFVRVLDRAVHAVTEAKLAGEPECQVADLEPVSRLANALDHAAVVVGCERPFDDALEPESLAEISLFHGLNLTGHRARRGSRRARAALASHRGTWPVRHAAHRRPRRPPRRPGSPAPFHAPTGRTNAPTCCSASSFPRDRRAQRCPRVVHPTCLTRAWFRR